MQLTPQMMDRILELCMPKLNEEDLLKLEEKLAKMVPPKALAADAAIKRRQFLALDHRMRRGSGTVIAEDRAATEAVFPHAYRLEGGSGFGAVPPASRQQQCGTFATDAAEFERMFPHAKRLG